MNEDFVKNSVVNAKMDPKVCHRPIHIQFWFVERFSALQSQFFGKNLLLRMSRGC